MASISRFRSFRNVASNTWHQPTFNRTTRFAPLILANLNKQFCTNASATLNKDSLKELRSISEAPLKECKKALSETNNNIQEALDWLRIQGIATARKKSDQVAANGFIVSLINENNNNNKYASVAEVNCVTDFVENNPIFQDAVMNIGNTILNCNELECNKLQNINEISNNIKIIPFQTDNNNNNNISNQTLNEALTDIISSIRENLVLRRYIHLFF